MKPSLKTLAGAAAALAVVVSAVAGVAQTLPPSVGGPIGGPGGPGAFGHNGGPPSPEMRGQMLRDRLTIRADQEPALKAFLDASGPPMGPGARGARRAQRQMTTPERLDEQLDEMRKRVDATKKFYATLSPDQKATFDTLPMAMGLEGRGGGAGRGGRRGPGGPGGPNQGFGAPPQP